LPASDNKAAELDLHKCGSLRNETAFLARDDKGLGQRRPFSVTRVCAGIQDVSQTVEHSLDLVQY